MVDASVAVQAALAEGSLAGLRKRGLVAPSLLWSEVTSVLHELSWRGALPPPPAAKALERFELFPIERRQPEGLGREAWAVADRLGWARTYDAEYVALARLLDCRLVTIDGRLRRGAEGLATIVGPTEV